MTTFSSLSAEDREVLAQVGHCRQTSLEAGYRRAVEQVDEHPAYAIFHAVRAGVLRLTTQAYQQRLEYPQSGLYVLGMGQQGLRHACKVDLLSDLKAEAQKSDDPDIQAILQDARFLLSVHMAPECDQKTSEYLRWLRLLAEVRDPEDGLPGMDKKVVDKRAQINTLGTLDELITVARNAEVIDPKAKKPEQIWNDPAATLARKAFYTHSVENLGHDKFATALRMCMEFAGYPVNNIVDVRDEWETSAQTAKVLLKRRRVPLSEVRHILEYLVEEGSVPKAAVAKLIAVWEAEDEGEVPRFLPQLQAGLQRNKVNTGDLGRYFAVRDKRPDLKPSQPAQNAVKRGYCNRYVPFTALAVYAGQSPDDMRDMAELRRRELTESAQLRWPDMKTHVYVERRLCGIEPDELPYDVEKYLHFERGTKKTGLQEQRVLQTIRSLSVDKLIASLRICFAEEEQKEAGSMSLEQLVEWYLRKKGHWRQGMKMPADMAGHLLGPLPQAVDFNEQQDAGECPMIFDVQVDIHDLMARINVVHDTKRLEEQRQAEAVVQRIKSSIDGLNDTTVAEMVSRAGEIAGSLYQLSKSMPKTGFVRHRCPSSQTLRHLADETPCRYPALPEIEQLAYNLDRVVTSDVRTDWAHQYACMQHRKELRPLRRTLEVVIGKVAHAPSVLCEDSSALTSSQITKRLNAAQQGYEMNWQSVVPILTEAGLQRPKHANPYPPEWTFVKCMFEADFPDLTDEEIITEAKKNWRKIMRQTGQTVDENPFTMPGLRWEDIRRVRTKKKKK